jgi:hypothetical protein
VEERLQCSAVYHINVEYIDTTNNNGDLIYELRQNQFAALTH